MRFKLGEELIHLLVLYRFEYKSIRICIQVPELMKGLEEVREEDEKSGMIRKRGAIRLLAELIVLGVVQDPNLLLGVIKNLV